MNYERRFLMPEIFVDYNRIGRATRFVTPLFLEDRQGLDLGDQVKVVGDDVESHVARVVAFHDAGRSVELEFC